MRDFNMQPAQIEICQKVVKQCKHEVASSLAQKLYIEKVELLTHENKIDFELALSLIGNNDVYETLSYYFDHMFYEDMIIIKTRNICSHREFPIHTGKIYERLEQLYVQTGVFIGLKNQKRAYGYVQRHVVRAFKKNPQFLN